ncbi:MAG: hypothetical protein FWE64_03175 [Alphaproteobacteria bacterium]|nr:hypothetical protein [Alphaproteobacteria bacterium]
MKKSLLFALCGMLYVGAADAQWERRPVWHDDGMRVTLSVRGGFAMGAGRIRNEYGFMPENYYDIYNEWDIFVANATETYVYRVLFGNPEFSGFTWDYIGTVDIGALSAGGRYKTTGFSGNVAVGFTLPNSPQWRLEADWLHFSETAFKSSPMFNGVGPYSPGLGDVVTISSSDVRARTTGDIVSMMMYYDFFEGRAKRPNEFIPYIGFGFGYASMRTVLELLDLFGELSDQPSLEHMGDPGLYVRDFYTSENNFGTIAGTVAAGFSFGIMDGLFLDGSVRLTYIPKVMFSLNNDFVADFPGSRTADVFSVTGLTYTTILFGLRAEF